MVALKMKHAEDRNHKVFAALETKFVVCSVHWISCLSWVRGLTLLDALKQAALLFLLVEVCARAPTVKACGSPHFWV